MRPRPAPYLISRLTDGLGNQLFQYAVARSFTRASNYELLLDLRWFNHQTTRKYLLNHFKIEAKLAAPNQLPVIGPKGLIRLMFKAWLRMRGQLITSRGVAAKSIARLVKPKSYFYGYWQWPHYFLQDGESLRKELQLVVGPSAAAQAIIAKMRRTTSVSLHVRRGDYFNNSKFSKDFGICGASYYENAASKMSALLNQQPTYFVFSDDLAWAQAHLRIPGEVIFVDLNDDATPHEDLRLMSSCKHHIISNSTFSWWGAWLNPDPKKIVVAPRYWLATEKTGRWPLLLPEFVLVENGSQTV